MEKVEQIIQTPEEKIKHTQFLETISVDNVVIVGGGTAGWLSALALVAYCPYIKVTLIQPKINQVIGVGESTQPDLISLLTAAGIDQTEFMTACDASFKCGIYYEDWNEIGSSYWHPFSSLAYNSTYTVAHHYQQMILREPDKYTHEDYYDAVHPSYAMCVKNNFVDTSGNIAVHVDADKMHRFLRAKLPSVTVLEPESIEIFSEDQKIAYVECDKEKVFADLFIDCTGFKRVLMNEIGNTETEFYHENVETAIFARIPYIDIEKEMVPYTKAHAQKHGWIWTTPLASRIGSGYVYTRNSCTPEEAEKEFIAYWGEDRLKGAKFNHIHFDSTPLTTAWYNNVVAIGLSAGFIEPLEATGISWSITGITGLCKLLGRGYYDNNTRTMYNANMRNYVQDVQDFIDIHYKLSARKDTTLWEYHSTRRHHPRLDKKLEIYKREMPAYWNKPKDTAWAFNEVSWLDVLNGYKFQYNKVVASEKDIEAATKELKRLKAVNKGRLEHGMTSYQLLKQFYDPSITSNVEELRNKQQPGT